MKTILLLLAALSLAPSPSAAQAPDEVTTQLMSADAGARRAAVAQVLARPEAVDPFVYAPLSLALWNDGRRLQAAFWFYLFQARTRPWADVDPTGMGALRASLNEELGSQINGWLGSDLAAWQGLVRRALDYEARLPLAAARPDGVSAADWQAAVVKARASYRAGFEQTLARQDAKEHAQARRANGLAVSPLEAPGPALPEGWR